MLDAWIQFTGEWHLSRLDEVIDQFSRAVELDPNLSRAYRGLGQAMILKGDVAQGLTLSRRGFELGPSDPDNLLFLGIALFESGELAEATKKIEQALKLHPLRPSYYSYFYAMILWANERFEEVLTELATVPGNEVWRALALVGLGRVAEAREQIAKYQARLGHPQVMPPHPPALRTRFLEGLGAAGWRPLLAAQKKAV
jgi:tetratricopeptide (TPR) repeat protein